MSKQNKNQVKTFTKTHKSGVKIKYKLLSTYDTIKIKNRNNNIYITSLNNQEIEKIYFAYKNTK